MLPNFIIAGGPKCGTTALWKYLNKHPEICLSEWKEPKFFTQCENNLGNNIIKPGPNRIPNYHKGLDWYKKLFDCETNAKMIGEASTTYMSMPDSPFLIAKHIPDVKLIFVLRDPVHRMYSHYWHNFKRGIKLPKFEEMVASNHSGFKYYEYVSHYKQHLERYFSVFEPEQIKIILFDDLKNRSENVYSDLFDFLDVDTTFIPDNIENEVNPYTIPKFMMIERIIIKTRFMKISQKIPKSLKKVLVYIREIVSSINREVGKYPEISPDLYKKLCPRFEEDICYLENKLNRSLEIWQN